MPYALRPDLSYTVVGTQVIFLDTAADRYFSLSGPVDDAFRRFVHDRASCITAAPAAALLVARKLIVPAERSLIAPVRIATIRNASNIRRTRPSGRITLGACYSILAMRFRLKVYPFRQVLTCVSRHGVTSGQAALPTWERIESIVAAFDAAKILLPSHDRCLSHSLAMGRQLRRCGVECDIVLGVAVKPFSAHCWVQRDGCVLNDDLEHVRTFSPIRVL